MIRKKKNENRPISHQLGAAKQEMETPAQSRNKFCSTIHRKIRIKWLSLRQKSLNDIYKRHVISTPN